jgi:RND family efflux transporter MFP subunit
VDVFADTSGKLTKLNVRLGQYVVKDQVIAEIDPSRPGMTFVASPVKSPIAGTVIELPAQVGATISPAMPIAKVSQTTDVQIMTYISERFISKVGLRLQGLLRFEAYPDERFRAWVSEVSPVVDPRSRTLEVRLDLVRPDRRIKPGMFAEVKIITERKDGIVKIPADCLVKRYGGYYVFVVADESAAERRKVTPGIEIDGKLEIVDGLEAGEDIVIRGQTLLEDKAKVRIIERVQPLAAEDIVE